MKDRQARDSLEFENRLREWSGTEPAVGDERLGRMLLNRMADRRPRHRVRFVLVAAATSLALLLIGFETIRRPATPHVDAPVVVYDVGDNVILVVRDRGEPIYVVTEPAEENGERP
jgi:hypothetical protein